MDLTIYLLALLIGVIIYILFLRHDSHLPPCPVTPLPLVGHLLFLEKNTRAQFKTWRKKCGDIYSLYLGQSLVVVINGYELVKEALVKNGDLCTGRPYTYLDAATGAEGRGITFSSGEIWKEQRAVTMNIMRLLGATRSTLADKIEEIVTINNETLASLNGEPTNINDIITTSIANVICSIILGHRFNHNDEDFIKFCQYFRDIVLQTQNTNLVNFYPFLNRLPFDIFGAKTIKVKAEFILNNFAARFVKQKGYDEFDENNLNNYIALYVHEMNKKLKAGESTTMSVDNLNKVVFDLFGAGMETLSPSILWYVLYMLHYPDIQEKVYREIQTEVGTERLPNMSDKNRLSYMNAVIMEVQRLASIVPLNLIHVCTENIYIRGYTIPKGAQIIPSIDSILFDKKSWGEDAGSFRPERFLDENGKVKHPEEFVPFSLGKRVCAGESMAKVELFMFCGGMTQRFQFFPLDPESLPPIKAVFGLTTCPVPYRVRLVDRKSMQ